MAPALPVTAALRTRRPRVPRVPRGPCPCLSLFLPLSLSCAGSRSHRGMPNAVLSALGKGQDRTPTSQTPPKQNARSPLYFLHASKKSFFLLQDSTLFLYRKRVARHLQQLFWLGSHAQKFCFAGLSTILGRIPNVEKWLKKVPWPLSSMLRNFFVLISTALAQALTVLSAAPLAMNICSTFFPHMQLPVLAFSSHLCLSVQRHSSCLPYCLNFFQLPRRRL